MLTAQTPNVVLDISSLLVDYTNYSSARVLVRFQPHVTQASLAASLPAGTQLGESFPGMPGLYEVDLAPGVSVADALTAFRDNPFVIYAEPDYQVRAALVPNDPRFGEQWAHLNTGQASGTIDADLDSTEAWDTFTGNDRTIVAVIDTGVDYRHPDLAANMWVNPGEIAGNRVDDDRNGYVDDVHGYDFVNSDGDPMDDNGHGTHVAGIIGAVGNNGIGVAGVAWSVRIMALKFLNVFGGGDLSDAVRAVNYAVANGASVSNASWGGAFPFSFAQALYDAIGAAGNQGHLFIAAAGNDGANNDSRSFYPAGFDLPNIVAVASSNRFDRLSDFSNFGLRSVDIAAPGEDILSTTPGNTYSSFSGTSMAVPHVVGVAALVKGLHPDWTHEQIIRQILDNVERISAFDGRLVTGGRMNSAASATGIPPPDTNGPRITAMTPSGGVRGPISQVRVTFSEAIDVGTLERPESTFTVADITEFTGPSGPLAVTGLSVVEGSGNRQFDITFAPQTQLGTYRMVIGPYIADVNGNLMNQDGDNINGEEPGVTGSPSPDAFQASFTLTDRLTFDSHEVPLGIFDWTVSISRLTIEQDMTVGDLNLQVNINHSYVGDLRIMLVAPDGTQVRLISPSFYRGGANFTNTVFDDEAGRTINQGQAPYTGSYRPQQPLSALDGKNARGSWELRVEDFFFIDEGVINSWSVTITPAGSAGVGPLAVGGWGSGAQLASVPLSSNNPGLDRSILDNLGAVLALPDDAMPAELPSPDQPAVPPPDGETIDSFFVDWGREEQDWVAPLPTRSNLALPEEPWEEFLGETPGLD